MSHAVKYRTVSVTVYPVKRGEGNYWQFKRQDGTQVTRADLAKAKRDALLEAQTVFKGGLSIDDLTPDQIRGIKRMIEVDPDLRTVDEFLVWHGRKAPRKNMGTAIDEFLASKKSLQGGSKLNHRTLGVHMKALEGLRTRSLSDIAVSDLPSLRGAPRTRQNTRAAWITFFRWAAEQDYLPHGEKTAPERLGKPIEARKEPTTYTHSELEILLRNVDPRFAVWLILAAFAGIRAAEICQPATGGKKPLVWEDFAWDRGVIIIRAETAKTGMRRIIPILPALEHWIKPYRKDAGRVYTEATAPSQSTRAGKPSETTRLGALIGGWKRNALRHSWISYRSAICGISQVANEAGNSESMARKSYNSAKSKEDAAKWFSVGLAGD